MSAPQVPQTERLGERRLVDAGLLLLLGFGVAAAWLDLSAVRPFVVLATAALVPGGALLTVLPPPDLLTRAALAVAMSAAVETTGALLLAWAHWWHPMWLGAGLAVLSATLLVRDILRWWPPVATAVEQGAP